MKLPLAITLLLIATAQYAQPLNYNQFVQDINTNKATFKTKYLTAINKKERMTVIDAARTYITNSMTTIIIPQWYGTSWSFEGHSEQPKNGSIACGYFVSTTLKHSGFTLNRYKLAQKNPEKEAISIQSSDAIIHLENKSISEFKTYFLANFKDGIYFVGLDFHVGYLQKEGNNLYFIHSNYIHAEGVTKEEVSNSKAFKSTNYYIASITCNDSLVKKWLLNEVIPID